MINQTKPKSLKHFVKTRLNAFETHRNHSTQMKLFLNNEMPSKWNQFTPPDAKCEINITKITNGYRNTIWIPDKSGV